MCVCVSVCLEWVQKFVIGHVEDVTDFNEIFGKLWNYWAFPSEYCQGNIHPKLGEG